jgi:hypothetical protein
VDSFRQVVSGTAPAGKSAVIGQATVLAAAVRTPKLASSALPGAGSRPTGDRDSFLTSLERAPKHLVSDRFGAAPEALKRDPAFLREVVARVPELLGRLASKHGIDDSGLRADRGLMEGLLSKWPYYYDHACPELRKDPDFAEKAFAKGYAPNNLLIRVTPDGPLFQNPSLLEAMVRHEPDCLKSLPDYQFKDPNVRQVLLSAISTSPALLAKGSEAMKNDRELVLLALNRLDPASGAAAASMIGPGLKGDAEVSKAATRFPPTLGSPTQIETAPPQPASAANATPTERKEILASVSAGSMSFAKVPPELRRDPEIALAGLEPRHGTTAETWASLDPALQNDPAFQRRAVTVNKDLFKLVDPSLRSDKALLMEIVRHDGCALKHASDALRSDPELVRAAVKDNGLAIEFAGDALKRDKSLALEAVFNQPDAFIHLDPKLKADPDVAFEAYRTCVKGEDFLEPTDEEPQAIPESLRENREFMLRLAKANIWSFGSVHSSLLRDRTFDAEVSMAFPPVLDRFGAELREELFQLRPELRQRYETVKQQLKDLGIEDPMRLRSSKLLDEVLRNRLAPESDKDKRPTALLVFGKTTADPTRAFYHNNLDDLTKHYRVMYYEASSEDQLMAALRDGSKRDTAELLMVGGHGNREGLNLGRDHDHYDGPRAPGEKDPSEALLLDLTDEDQLKAAGLQNVLRPDAKVVLDSCSTGEGGAEGTNLANVMARVFPGREVIAPMEPVTVKLRVDDEGRFVDPGYSHGDVVTYRTRRPV